jgi:peptidyl-prolyl cis-trans isomerase C
VIAAAMVLAGCQEEQSEQASTQNTGEAVAHVNGEPISKRMFEFHLERRTGGQPQLASPEQRQALLQELVDMTLLAQEAERQNLADDQEVAARLQNLRAAVLAQAAVEQMIKQEPDEAALKAEYEKQFGGDQQQEYHARHILVESQEEAQKIINQLQQGAEFAKLAEQHSTGPTGPNGGDLGWFQPQQMVPPFAEAVQKLEPGNYTTEPVQTQFGWHVVKLEATRPVEPPPMEEVRQQLIAAMSQQRVESRLEELRKQAEIKTDLPEQPAQPVQSPVVQPNQQPTEQGGGQQQPEQQGQDQQQPAQGSQSN